MGIEDCMQKIKGRFSFQQRAWTLNKENKFQFFSDPPLFGPPIFARGLPEEAGLRKKGGGGEGSFRANFFVLRPTRPKSPLVRNIGQWNFRLSSPPRSARENPVLDDSTCYWDLGRRGRRRPIRQNTMQFESESFFPSSLANPVESRS